MLSIWIVSVLLVLALWNLCFQKHWDSQLRVSATFKEESVYAGDETRLTEVIENHKKMPIPVLEVGFHTKKELDFQDTDNTSVSDYLYKRDIFSIMGWQKITRQISVKCKKRGFYQIQEIDLYTYSLLHNKKYGKIRTNDASIFVYPARTHVEDLVLICESLSGTVQCAKHLYEDPFAFRSIREYTLEDPMKTLNWKASAKSGKLMVNTYDSALIPKVMIFLDLEDGGILKHDELIEESISIATSLAGKLLKQGMEVGFLCNGKVEGKEMALPLSNQRNQIFQLERMLALYQTTEPCTNFDKMLTEYHKKHISAAEDAVLVFISKNAKEVYYQKMQEMLGKEGQGLWVCPIEQEEINKDRCVTFPPSRVKYVIRGVERS